MVTNRIICEAGIIDGHFDSQAEDAGREARVASMLHGDDGLEWKRDPTLPVAC